MIKNLKKNPEQRHINELMSLITLIAKTGFHDDYEMIKSKFEFDKLNLNLVLTSFLSILPNEQSIL